MENLFLAWKEFKKGKGSKLDVQEFEFNLEENIFQLQDDLKTKSYRHNPYTSFYVTDPKLRHIHKACVRDRVLRHAIFRILYPIFDRNFIYDSYSCRLGKIIDIKDGFESSLIPEESFRQSLNSYRGMIRHCNGYDLEAEIIWLSGLAEIKI